MQKDVFNKIDTAYVEKCIQANQHNALTSYYYLLTKKMKIQGDELDDESVAAGAPEKIVPMGSQVKKY